MHKNNLPVIYWLRSDFRMYDNIALNEAVKNNKKVILVYFYNYLSKVSNKLTAENVWTEKSLNEIDSRFKEKYNIEIYRFNDDPKNVFKNMYSLFGISKVYYNRIYEPKIIKSDSLIENFFVNKIIFESYNSSLLFEPMSIKNNAGSFFKVYTPFWKNSLTKLLLRQPLRPPKSINSFKSKKLLKNDISIKIDSKWIKKLFQYFKPGEINARKKLMQLGKLITDYSKYRDFPIYNKTSQFSPYFARGELSINEVMFHLVKNKNKIKENDFLKFTSQLGWREFSYNILNNFPELAHKNFNKKFDNFKWEKNEINFSKWKEGKTGYPIIDAGMRELWITGYMHNRIRMVVASFLVKDLFIDWRKGREWFAKTLFDHDMANNAAGWQWVAGSGTDAAPYFRIFNPILQSERFDSEGEYIRKWVPELNKLPHKFIHAPWKLENDILKKYNVVLGKTYPYPIVDHKKSRDKALMLYKKLGK